MCGSDKERRGKERSRVCEGIKREREGERVCVKG